MTKKLPPSPWERVTAGPFKILVYGEILLVSHHRAYWISNSKVGETKLIGGNTTEIVILLALAQILSGPASGRQILGQIIVYKWQSKSMFLICWAIHNSVWELLPFLVSFYYKANVLASKQAPQVLNVTISQLLYL